MSCPHGCWEPKSLGKLWQLEAGDSELAGSSETSFGYKRSIRSSFILSFFPPSGVCLVSFLRMKRKPTQDSLVDTYSSVVVQIGTAPMAHVFACLVTTVWHYLRRIRRCGLVGGLSLRVSFKVSKAHAWTRPPRSAYDQDVECLANSPTPCLSASRHVTHHDTNGLTSEMVSHPPLMLSFVRGAAVMASLYSNTTVTGRKSMSAGAYENRH